MIVDASDIRIVRSFGEDTGLRKSPGQGGTPAIPTGDTNPPMSLSKLVTILGTVAAGWYAFK